MLSTLSHGIVITKTEEAINFKKEFYVIMERDEDGYFVREVLQILSPDLYISVVLLLTFNLDPLTFLAFNLAPLTFNHEKFRIKCRHFSPRKLECS